MVELELKSKRFEENFRYYLNQSRRDLQILCKNNKLPANRSHFQLAESLALFIEKNNAVPNSMKVNPMRLVPEKIPEDSEVFSEDTVTAYGKRAHLGESDSNKAPSSMRVKEVDDRHHSVTGQLVDHQASDNAYSTAANAFNLNDSTLRNFGCNDKVGNGGPGCSTGANIQQIKKDREASNSVPNSIATAAKSSTKCGYLPSKDTCTEEIPSFQFFVRREDGLNLLVDLSSSPSEWVRRLKNETEMSLNMQDCESRTLSGHIDSLSENANALAENSDAHAKVVPLEVLGGTNRIDIVDKNSGCTTSTLSSDSENYQFVAPLPDPACDSSVLTLSSTIRMHGHSNENQDILSCEASLRDPKIMEVDTVTSVGDGSAFSSDLVDASSQMEQGNTCISMRPISDLGVLSSEGTRNSEQMECLSSKIDDDPCIVETDGLDNSLETISKENNILKSDGTDKVVLMSDMGNIANTKEVCAVSRKGFMSSPADVATDCARSSSFNGVAGDLPLDDSVSGVHSDTKSMDYDCRRHACNLDNPDGKFPISLIPELGKSTQLEEQETSECSPYQKVPEDNSKRSRTPDAQEDFHNKKHHSDGENKGEMVVNLRSSRTSVKETAHEQAVRPRRSTRLLEGSF